MSFWSRWFGSKGGSEPAPASPAAEVAHGPFTIRAEPYRNASGQFQTAGTVVLVVDGAPREHRFVRADSFPTQEDAAEFALRKGRQIADEQGEALFGLPRTARTRP